MLICRSGLVFSTCNVVHITIFVTSHTHRHITQTHIYTALEVPLSPPSLSLSRSLARSRAHTLSLSLYIQESPRLRRTRREAGCGRQRQGRWGRCCYVHVRLKSMHIRAHKYSHIPTLNTHPHAREISGRFSLVTWNTGAFFF